MELNDLRDALKDLLNDSFKKMLEAVMDKHLGYERGQISDSTNSKNDLKSKKN